MPGGQATKGHSYSDYHFGVPDKGGSVPKISVYKDSVWISDRRLGLVNITRDEALELAALLYKVYPLDALGSV